MLSNHHTFAYKVKRCKEQKDPWSSFASGQRITATYSIFQTFLCCQSKQELRMRGDGLRTLSCPWFNTNAPTTASWLLKKWKTSEIRHFSIKQIGLTQPKENKTETTDGDSQRPIKNRMKNHRLEEWLSQPASKAGLLNEFLAQSEYPVRLKLAGFSGGCFCSSQEWGGAAEIPSTQACGKRSQLLTRRLTERKHRTAGGSPQEWVQTLFTATTLPCSLG